MKDLKRVSLFVLIAVLFLAVSQPAVADKGKININTATRQELVTLKYVGEKLADRIIEYRKSHPFKKPSDIMKVKGVGQKIFDANKDIIVVKGS